MEALAEFADPNTTIALNHNQAAVYTNGVPYFAPTVELAIVAAADALGLT
jgi:hypothetical protein